MEESLALWMATHALKFPLHEGWCDDDEKWETTYNRTIKDSKPDYNDPEIIMTALFPNDYCKQCAWRKIGMNS